LAIRDFSIRLPLLLEARLRRCKLRDTDTLRRHDAFDVANGSVIGRAGMRKFFAHENMIDSEVHGLLPPMHLHHPDDIGSKGCDRQRFHCPIFFRSLTVNQPTTKPQFTKPTNNQPTNQNKNPNNNPHQQQPNKPGHQPNPMHPNNPKHPNNQPKR
jgi:hypothetical protein